MRELILNQQGKAMQRISEFGLIEEALEKLDGDKHSRIMLSDDDGGYIRILGRKDMLAICHGRRIDTVLGHYVLSLSKRDEELFSFSFGTVTTEIQQNEVLAYEDALLLVNCFFYEKDFPPAYNMRELEKPLF
ncbi:MAG: hypothetical protein AAF696_13225 [Bacteroidota bacterium]